MTSARRGVRLKTLATRCKLRSISNKITLWSLNQLYRSVSNQLSRAAKECRKQWPAECIMLNLSKALMKKGTLQEWLYLNLYVSKFVPFWNRKLRQRLQRKKKKLRRSKWHSYHRWSHMKKRSPQVGYLKRSEIGKRPNHLSKQLSLQSTSKLAVITTNHHHVWLPDFNNRSIKWSDRLPRCRWRQWT